jgi:hypothetical protein
MIAGSGRDASWKNRSRRRRRGGGWWWCGRRSHYAGGEEERFARVFAAAPVKQRVAGGDC